MSATPNPTGLAACCSQPASTAQLAQPSGVEDIEEQFLEAVQDRSATVRDLVEATVAENDALHLAERQDEGELAEERENFPRVSPDELTDRFVEWFRTVLEDEVLDPVPLEEIKAGEHWTGEFLRSGYLRAWQQATGRLQQEGADVDAQEIEAIIQLPVPQRQLRDLYRRAFSNLEDITDEMAQTVREELADGLEAGENPRTMARRLDEKLESETRSRLNTLARTEVINSHTEATLDRYERAGADTVRHGEWADAGDDDVCPICSSLDGREYTIDEMRSGTFEFEPGSDDPDYLAGEYPIRPPAHPNCRCTIQPVIT
ncbi:phage minor head protein [Natrinema amylolyticum]|uniref:phage head morphogenesis protein n=1 Tax=Natrinema amylolyticum TaxID=2878679 RepID=UPI001CFBFD41|nr:phage minor head protein [Natrinema amylolyticum]